MVWHHPPTHPPTAYPAKPSAPSAYSAPDDANAIKPGSAQHDGDEDISDTDDEQPNVTDKQRAQVAAMYLQATSGAGSGGGAGPTAGKEDDSGTDTDEDGALIQKVCWVWCMFDMYCMTDNNKGNNKDM